MITFHLLGAGRVHPDRLELCAELVRRSIWIDVFEPTHEEELALESALQIDVPTREEMQEIELSRRLYREKGELYMTVTVLNRSDTSHPESSAITFIMFADRLVTIRYADPVPFKVFTPYRESRAAEFDTAAKVFTGLVDAIVERLADILENTSAGMDRLSLEVLNEPPRDVKGKLAQRDYQEILRRLGRFSDLASRARESLVSLGRLISFFRESSEERPEMKAALPHLDAVRGDLASLSDHASFLSGKMSFLLDATLGLINNEQNGIIKIVSVGTVVFLPPTLVASIYGMNFQFMPELTWRAGYPLALAVMVISAVFPYAFFKRKGWL
jgi:magnesium transporter